VNLAKDDDLNVSYPVIMAIFTFFGFAAEVLGKIALDKVQNNDANLNPGERTRSWIFHFAMVQTMIFLLEDATTIFIFARVKDAYDAGSLADLLNAIFTMISAGIIPLVSLIIGFYIGCTPQNDAFNLQAAFFSFVPVVLSIVMLSFVVSTDGDASKEAAIVLYSCSLFWAAMLVLLTIAYISS